MLIDMDSPPESAKGYAVRWKVEKREGEWCDALHPRIWTPGVVVPKPYEVIEGEGNQFMYGGDSLFWEWAIGNGTDTADQTLTYLVTTTNTIRAAIAVGNGTDALDQTDTDLQGASKARKLCSTVTHNDGTGSAAASTEFVASFGTSEGNFAWEEWAVANSATLATGRIINRKLASLGTKSSGTWTFTVTLSIT
jgi:hypothetical protein